PDVWNTTKKVCESSVSCSGNKPFKTKKNTCVAYVTCKKAGTHLDEKTNTCAKDTKADCDTKKDHYWDDTKKACLTGSKETEESCGKKTGYHWNTKTKKCDKNVATCKKPQIKINGACEDPKKCAESESLDIKTNTCKACDGFMNKKGKCVPFLKCKEPKVLDKTTNTCSTPCPTGEVRPTKGAKQGKCVAKAKCKEGEDYDAAGNTCKAKACATGEVRPTKGTQKGTCVAKATCKDKEKYDVATNTCKAVACVRGEVKPTAGPNKDTCVKKATCKAPRKVLNKATNECECPKGQSYDEKNKKCSACKEGEVTVNGQCVPKTECKENETIDKKTNTCICKPTFVKPAGTEKCVAKATCKAPKKVLNKKTNECECPKGQLFSEKGNACLKCKTGEIIDTETGKCAKDTGAKNDTKNTTNSTTPAASVPLDAAALGTGVQSLTQSGLVSIAPPGSPYAGLPNYEGKDGKFPGAFPGVPPPTEAPPTETSNELQEVVNKFKKGF
ncbi:hypothetical protein EBR66_02365, partial [bacterium]|nr:hypothetical protein [bacterium]